MFSGARAAVVVALSVACGACQLPLPVYSPDPIPLEEAGTGGGLLSMGTAADVATPFPMLIDTASPLTSYSSGSQTVSATRGTVRLYASGVGVSEVPRLQLDNVQIFSTPLDPTGLDTPTPISGVFGGDNLSRFVVGMTYTPNLALNLSDNLILSDCEVGDRCGAVLPFTPAGGHEMIDIGSDIYAYTASYVLLDACVEPALDPLEAELRCQDPGCLSYCPQTAGPDQDECVASCASQLRGCDIDVCSGDMTSQACLDCRSDAQRYLSSGTDVRFAVASGFPGSRSRRRRTIAFAAPAARRRSSPARRTSSSCRVTARTASGSRSAWAPWDWRPPPCTIRLHARRSRSSETPATSALVTRWRARDGCAACPTPTIPRSRTLNARVGRTTSCVPCHRRRHKAPPPRRGPSSTIPCSRSAPK